MTALLRADWIRFRRRRDLWIIVIAVGVVGGLSFLAGYRADVSDPVLLSEADIRQEILSFSEFGGMTQAEIDAQVDLWVQERLASDEQYRVEWEANQQITLQKYVMPQSLLTVAGGWTAPLVALVLIASLALGDEFRLGTVRTSLLAAGDRRRFLGARLISLFAITLGLYAGLLVLAVVLSLGLVIVGAEVPAATLPLNWGAAIGLVAAEILSVTVVIALTAALTLLLRSGALPLLLVILAGLLEVVITSLIVLVERGTYAGVTQFFPANAIRALLARLSLDSGAIGLAEQGQPPPAPIDLSLPAVALIVIAWGLLFVVLADRRLRTMDIVE